ncbi:hypothetical protein [Paraburkholderia sp. EG304]|uniref:hypothetical protein n=1 Tax=Paraburkholderia sp. EG304 TaxID=3237015 RepID=UPI00397B4505
MKLDYPTRLVLRADGTKEALLRAHTLAEIEALIDASIFDTILLDAAHVMVVDDLGHPKGKPVNKLATELYLMRCLAGTTHEIRGDVVILPDSDFAPPALRGAML